MKRSGIVFRGAGSRLEERDRQRLNALYDTDIQNLAKYLRGAVEGRDLLLCITATHGYELHDHGSVHFGHTLHREAGEVPLLVVGPGIAAGRLIEMAASLDEVLPALVGRGALGEALRVGHAPVARAAITRLSPTKVAVRYGRWRVIWQGVHKQLMYDVIADPSEKRPLNPAPVLLKRLLHDITMLEMAAHAL